MRPYFERDGITIYHGRCEDVLPALVAVDVVITDPPYSEHVHGKSRRGSDLPDAAGGRGAEISRVKEFGFDAITEELRARCAAEFARLARRWVLAFSDVESTHLWRAALVGAGLDYVRTGAWVKVGATPQFTGDRPATGFEAVTIAHPAGRKRWNGGGKHAVWTHPIVLNRGGNDPRLHTTQKPIDLMRDLVALFSEPGETILDAFMGSGTTLRAAKDLGRKAIGIEMDERYCEIAARRLSQMVLPLGAA